MYRFLKLPQVVFNEELELEDELGQILTPDKVPIRNILNTAITKEIVIGEDLLRSISSVIPMYPFKTQKFKKDAIEPDVFSYPDISVIEFVRTYETGLISSSIKNIKMSPADIIELVNTTLNNWDEEDYNEHMERMIEMELLKEEIEKVNSEEQKPKVKKKKPTVITPANSVN